MSARDMSFIIDLIALCSIMLLALVGQMWSAVLAACVAGAWALLCYVQGLRQATTGKAPTP